MLLKTPASERSIDEIERLLEALSTAKDTVETERQKTRKTNSVVIDWAGKNSADLNSRGYVAVAQKLENQALRFQREFETAYKDFVLKGPAFKRFAGVYFSDDHSPIRISPTEQFKWASRMHCGVVAVSGVVPLTCCDADIVRLQNGGLYPGKNLFLALQTKTGGSFSALADYCQVVRPDKEAGVYPQDSVSFAISGEFSHQQLAAAPVCLVPPAPSDADITWGCPKFAPVVVDTDWWSSPEHPSCHPLVSGAAHVPPIDPTTADNMYTQLGARVYRIVDADTLVQSARTFGIENDADTMAKLFEQHFIGTFVSRIEDGGGLMVDLGVLLSRTA